MRTITTLWTMPKQMTWPSKCSASIPRTITLREDYWPKFEKALGGKRAAKFYQVDNRLSMIINLELTSAIPILKSWASCGRGGRASSEQGGIAIEGAMIGGFALIAAPAEYRVTGVKTFIVSYNGIVYQKDPGPDTLNIAKKIEPYNPDKTWHRTDDQWPMNDFDESASGP